MTRRRLRSERGIYLLQVVVLLALLSFMVGLVMQVVFARRTTDKRAVDAETKRLTGLALESQVMDCINQNNPGYGSGATCAFGAAATCISNLGGLNNLNVSISPSGAPPSCGIQISVLDP